MADTPAGKQINPKYSTEKIRVNYAHVGLYDVSSRKIWVAKKRRDMPAVRISHARLLKGGTQDTSTADKDKFMCYWFHTPGTGQGYVLGYPIEWDEGHLMFRVDPNWDYANKRFIPSTDTARVRKNVDQQYEHGQYIFNCYVAAKPKFPLSWHLVGPRATDSMFYIQRVESSKK